MDNIVARWHLDTLLALCVTLLSVMVLAIAGLILILTLLSFFVPIAVIVVVAVIACCYLAFNFNFMFWNAVAMYVNLVFADPNYRRLANERSIHD